MQAPVETPREARVGQDRDVLAEIRCFSAEVIW